jgi:oxygen-dependent protoporphyrinogen oxidase
MTVRGRVVVVGGGIAGLTAAWRLAAGSSDPAGDDHTPVDVVVLEASGRGGGTLRTIEVAGAPVEAGPDSFVVRKPWAVNLCRELGLGGDLLAPGASGAFVWARGRLRPFPEGSAFGIPPDAEAILRWQGLSVRGRMSAALDLWRGRRGRAAGRDESVGSLVSRRMGRECADVLVGPLLAGIHAADPDRLSVEATFPELSVWERGHGSLIRGARAAARSARRASGSAGGPMFTTLDGGLERLPGSLVSAIGPDRVRTSATVEAIRPTDGGTGYEVLTAAGERLAADAVIVAVPAHEATRLLGGLSGAEDAADALSSIRYVSTATVTLVYPEGTAERLPEATGFLVPPARVRGEAPGPAVITACTFVSRKWPDPGFGDRAIVRCFVGRDGEQEPLGLGDERLAAVVAQDVEAATEIGAEPEATAVVRWDRSMPQYDVGHLARVDAADAALAAGAPGLFLTGSAYRGVGIADCVRQGNEAAERVRSFLGTAAPAAAGDERQEATT